MLKKIALLAISAALALTLSACGGGQAEPLETLESPDSSGIELAPVDRSQFDDNLDGLCKYMEENQAVIGEKVEMSYKEIGALAGWRYLFKFDGSTVQVEFYEYDLENLDEKGQDCIHSVQEKGFFTILGNDVPATLAGKYLMIYTDADQDEVNTAQKEKVNQFFLDFAK